MNTQTGKFENPYHELDESQLTRLQTYVSQDDHNFLFRTLHPGQGSVTVVTNTLFHKLVEALQKHNITDHATQRLEFEQFVAEMEFTIPKKKGKK